MLGLGYGLVFVPNISKENNKWAASSTEVDSWQDVIPLKQHVKHYVTLIQIKYTVTQ